MRKLIILLFITTPLFLQAQLSIGVKAGLNLANVSSTTVSTNMYTGYMIGGYLSPKQKKVLGFRSEIILSRQGYDYKTNTNSGKVDLDYLLLPQLFVLQFTKKFQVHLGGQLAFLLNAKVDSSGGPGNGSLFDYFNRFDYGAAGGVEVSPLGGLFIGARMNISLNNINKEAVNSPNFISRDLIRNNVVQVYVGWRL